MQFRQGQGIVEGCVGIDWHDTGSLMGSIPWTAPLNVVRFETAATMTFSSNFDVLQCVGEPVHR
jgi:hypothetical protein